MNNVGEAQITPQVAQQVAPDATATDGQQQLFHKAVEAHLAKKQLDAVMQAVADHLGATTSSRVKNIETATQKIAQKRLQGRDYSHKDINDMLGARLVVSNEKQFPKAQAAVEKLASAGVFDIAKQQKVKQGTYEAYHFDVVMGNGTKAEIQIHTPQSEAEAVANHSLRAQYGENPDNDAITQLKNKQAQIAKGLPNNSAQAVTQALQGIAKQQGGLTSPQQSAQALALASQQ